MWIFFAREISLCFIKYFNKGSFERMPGNWSPIKAFKTEWLDESDDSTSATSESVYGLIFLNGSMASG